MRDNALASTCMHTHQNVYFYTNAHLHILALTFTRTIHTQTNGEDGKTGKFARKRHELKFMVWQPLCEIRIKF